MSEGSANVFWELRRLLDEDPALGPERAPGGFDAYASRKLDVRACIDDPVAYPPRQEPDGQFLCRTAFRLASLECAAGASVARCRAWFACLADAHLLSYGRPASEQAMVRSVTCRVLAGDLSRERYRAWPGDIRSGAPGDRFVYAFGTGKPLDLDGPGGAENPSPWRLLSEAIAAADDAAAAAVLESSMDVWLEEIQSPPGVRDLKAQPVFDSCWNASLVLAEERLGVRLSFSSSAYEQLFLGARVANSP